MCSMAAKSAASSSSAARWGSGSGTDEMGHWLKMVLGLGKLVVRPVRPRWMASSLCQRMMSRIFGDGALLLVGGVGVGDIVGRQAGFWRAGGGLGGWKWK